MNDRYWPWLCLAVHVLGVLALLNTWVNGKGGGDSIVLYVLMILGGGVGFLVLL